MRATVYVFAVVGAISTVTTVSVAVLVLRDELCRWRRVRSDSRRVVRVAEDCAKEAAR